MDKLVLPGPRRGVVAAPPSKSDAHRALICAALSRAPAVLRLGALNGDIRATLRCLEALGVKITRGADTLTVAPQTARPSSPVLDCGESGSTLRFLLPAATLLCDRPRFVGEGRLPERPIGPLLEAMARNGCVSDSPRLPLTLTGALRAGVYPLPGNISSQYVSGLLMALAAVPGESELRLSSPLESAAYADMTIRTLSRFGVAVRQTAGAYQLSTVSCQLSSPGVYGVEGDWSGAAFFIALDALGGEVRVTGLDGQSAQPDRAIAALARALPEALDVSAFPDLFPVLSILACGKTGVTVLGGASRLRLKESDRVAAAANLIAALGGRCEQGPDSLTVYGTGRLKGGEAESENDHRVAMVAAVAAAICEKPVLVRGAEAVDKSYPAFWDDLERLEIL